MTPDTARLLRRITALATQLPSHVVHDVAVRLEAIGALDTSAINEALSSVHGGSARHQLSELLVDWADAHPETSPAALAWALRAAAAADTWHRKRQRLELVWTGPAPHGTTLRRTDQALLQLIAAAKRSITIITFAAYRVPDIRDALLAAAERGVAITFVVESSKASQGKVSFDPIVAMGRELVDQSTVYVWPLDQRERDAAGRHGTLHAKSAIVDDERLLISSANFTGDALLLNMELGLLVEGGELAAEVSEHLRALVVAGVLKAWSPEGE